MLDVVRGGGLTRVNGNGNVNGNGFGYSRVAAGESEEDPNSMELGRPSSLAHAGGGTGTGTRQGGSSGGGPGGRPRSPAFVVSSGEDPNDDSFWEEETEKVVVR